MTFEETNKNRRSIRDFKNTPVSDEIINQVLKEALEAPSSSNTQPFKVVVAKGNILKKIGEDLTFKYNTGQKLRKLNISEIGQIAGLIHEIKPAADIVKEIVNEFKSSQKSISKITF